MRAGLVPCSSPASDQTGLPSVDHVGFAVRRVHAVDHGAPEAVRHLLRRKIAPAARNVAFVLNLVIDDGLVPGSESLRRFFKVVLLQTGVRAPRLGVVVYHAAVMNRPQPAVRIAFLHDAKEAVPIGHRLRAHQVVFVGDRPPHVPVCGKPRHRVAQIAVVRLRSHGLESPRIVRMEENHIRLDAGSHQILNARLRNAESKQD